ncbi:MULTISPECIES: acyl-CoA dehydrogenase family protein [Rhodococcus]|uniref:Acyl-CoA dehydrogenase family protein n=1 Tax=Rhodococcus oxybenzonivorans TaxID=1990687 RepID=A0AAE4UXR8_9NOCA|nr:MULTISPECIES: acyl-CoA dehydrogenase family protein [Rhodococcus]MDV7241639.1 acyl-CoA dehydrogenase family protein [Rhodococcus oxybenzonivorans]MDV7264224.1 acyl-CoA dehydrogenase family protein [Rhodococcus oxybenzonivorans]MDV7273828.1 acyl-CoA dehydrogenase family protein [Rhodococcus oxybenzonivorans]MDV7333920.1 acyl-CoA dehydrogenase family protein [Rhodococcus oxybenzonivorans]MDV7343339.1 acyl-CoA dehydrogenase family protein [Rhodococcus oxybenzonivorans]
MTAVSTPPDVTATPRAQVDLDQLRREVQTFLTEARDRGRFTPMCDGWLRGFDLAFSRELSARGWLGVTWPVEYGGRNWPNAARFVITEELLRFGAPITAHWMGDRQIGPSLLRHGTDEQKAHFLPRIADSEITFCIGMSEPGSGSDLASVSTRAEPVEGGWSVTGTKVWTSHAHRASHGYLLARTSREGSRHQGLTEFVVDMNWPGITVTPILDMLGGHHFNQVVFDQVFVPADRVLGTMGGAWRQVTEQLSFERGGPERLLTTYPLLEAIVAAVTDKPHLHGELGEVISRMRTLRRMALALTDSLDRGEAPIQQAAALKIMGTELEQRIVDFAIRALDVEADPAGNGPAALLASALAASPGFTIRGGATAVLLSILAKEPA